MLEQRKVGGSSDGYIRRVGNLEFAYNEYGSYQKLIDQNLCKPVKDFFSPNVNRPAIGAFKVDGCEWVVCEAGTNFGEPHMFLVSKFAAPRDRLSKETFMREFLQVYADACIIEAQQALELLNKGESI